MKVISMFVLIIPIVLQAGTYTGMPQADAIKYCSDQGKRLPTVTEWIEFATQMGAEGRSDTFREWPYIPVFGLDSSSDQFVVDFYYNPEGFVAPNEEFQKGRFWSSSPHKGIYPGSKPRAYVFSGGRGSLLGHVVNDYVYAICVAK